MSATPTYTYGLTYGARLDQARAQTAVEVADLTVRWSELDAEQKARINAMINATASGRAAES